MSFELFIRTGEATAERVPLGAEPVSLGRAHTNRLCFPDDASLSRQHLRFDPQGGGRWSVVDLGSKNGTLVNGVRIEEARELEVGDRISAGRLTISFSEAGTGTTEERIEFYGGPGADEPISSATVMTSLEGLLSGEIRPGPAPAAAPAQPEPLSEPSALSQGAQFRSPVVRALIRAGRELLGHRPLDELFQMILDLSIEAVGAERGILMTLEGDDLKVRASHGEGFRMSTTVRDRVLREKASLLVRDAQADQAFAERLSISEQQIRTMMAAPLQTDDRVIGLVYVDTRFFVREFTPDDLNLLTVLANVAAIRIEHQRLGEVEQVERRMAAELDQAASIQRRLLPATAPVRDGFELAGHNAPCHTVGGDYYDFIENADGTLGLVLGDVAGKGMPAALLVSGLHARMQILVETADGPAELMSRLDRSVTSACPRNRFITCFYGLLDPADGKLHYCNAGHNEPRVIRGDGSEERLGVNGTVLGILPELGYEERTTYLGPGDLLLVFSDGISEAANAEDEEFGEDRLAALVREHAAEPAEKIVEIVESAVDGWTGGAPPADDMTLLIAKRL